MNLATVTLGIIAPITLGAIAGACLYIGAMKLERGHRDRKLNVVRGGDPSAGEGQLVKRKPNQSADQRNKRLAELRRRRELALRSLSALNAPSATSGGQAGPDAVAPEPPSLPSFLIQDNQLPEYRHARD